MREFGGRSVQADSWVDCTHGFKISMPKFQLARRGIKENCLQGVGKVLMTSKRNNISNKQFKMARSSGLRSALMISWHGVKEFMVD